MSQLSQRIHTQAYDTCSVLQMHFLHEVEEQREALGVLERLRTDSYQDSHTCPPFVLAVDVEIQPVAEKILVAAVRTVAVAVGPLWFYGSSSHTYRGTLDDLGWCSGDTLSSPGCWRRRKLAEKFVQTVVQHLAAVLLHCRMGIAVQC